MAKPSWPKYKKFKGVEYHLATMFSRVVGRARVYEEATKLRRQGNKAKVLYDEGYRGYQYAIYVR